MGSEWLIGGVFPPEVTSGMPRLLWYGCERLLVEQHRGILVCGREEMRFQTCCGVVIVEGSEMELVRYGTDEAVIKGHIWRVEYPSEGSR